MSQKAVVIIAGSWFGSGKVFHLIKAAQSLGLRAIVICQEEKYFIDWEVKPDLKIICDPREPTRFGRIKKQLLTEEVIYVAHGDDRAISLVCFLNSFFNLIGPTEDSYEVIYNKKSCSALLSSLGIPHAKEILNLSEHKGPLFIKPTRSSGTYSKHTYCYRKWSSKEELFNYLIEAGKFLEFKSLLNGKTQNSVGGLIAQEFIDDQVTYFADIFISKNGQVKTVVTNSIHWTLDGVEKTRQINRKTQYLNLKLSAEILSIVEGYAGRISDFLNYKNAWMSIEFWIQDGRPTLVEINPRSSGSTNEAFSGEASCTFLQSILTENSNEMFYASNDSLITVNHWLPNIGKGLIIDAVLPQDSFDCRLVKRDDLAIGSYIDSTGKKLIDWAPAVRAKAKSIAKAEEKVNDFLGQIELVLK